MPPVVAFFVAAIGYVASAVAVFFGSVGGIGAFLGKLVLNFAISALVGKLLAPSKRGGAASSSDVRNRQFVVRSSIQPRNILYGSSVTSGPLIFVHTSGANKEYLHMVVALVAHEVTAIPVVFFNDEAITADQIDGSGNVIAGRFAGHAVIKKYLGTAAQTADADLMSASGGIWTANHRLQGVAYVYVRFKHNYDVYESGLPNVKALVHGKKVYDPRDGQTRWTDNPALLVRDYLTNPLGLSASSGEVDDTICAAAANVCDERVAVVQTGIAVTFDGTTNTVIVGKDSLRFGNRDAVQFTTSGALPPPLATGTTYYIIRESATSCKLALTDADARDRVAIDFSTAGSGTHQMVHWDQPRYTGNGILSTDTSPRDNMQVLLTSMAGALPYVQGKYEVRAGAYTATTFALDEDDLRGPISVQAKTPRKELYNAVKGLYVEPWRYWQPTDFTPVTNSTYETQDGAVRIYRDIELVFTTNQIMAQRIGKLHLEKSRQGIVVTFPAKLRALKTKAWATVALTIAHLGWNAKVFRVIGWSLSPDGGVDLQLTEESSASYNWNSGEATVIDDAPDTNLPSKISVVAPTSFVLDSGSDQSFVNGDGTVTVRVFASWAASADAFVTNYDFQWKKSTDSVYQTTKLSASATTAFIEPAIEGVTYDVRIRAVNAYGAASAFVSSSIMATGKDVAPGAPSALATATVTGGIKLSWTNPADNDLYATEIWESATNDRASATKVTDAFGTFFTRTGLADGAIRYYWIRSSDTSGNLSGYHPTSSAAGVSGTVGSVSVDYSAVTGTKPPATADNTVAAVEAGATVTSGGITFSAGGAIKGGQTAYNTGAGWFIGYSSGQYKLSIGDPNGHYLAWDGTSLIIRGQVPKSYGPGSFLLIEANTAHNYTSVPVSLVKVKEILINGMGTLRLDIRRSITGGSSGFSSFFYAYAYRNGVQVYEFPSFRRAYNQANITQTDTVNININNGDLIQLYIYLPTSSGVGFTYTIDNFQLYNDSAPNPQVNLN